MKLLKESAFAVVVGVRDTGVTDEQRIAALRNFLDLTNNVMAPHAFDVNGGTLMFMFASELRPVPVVAARDIDIEVPVGGEPDKTTEALQAFLTPASPDVG